MLMISYWLFDLGILNLCMCLIVLGEMVDLCIKNIVDFVV